MYLIIITLILFPFSLGFGAGLVFTPCFIIIGLYFNKRKARAMSLATLGGGLGGIAFPPLLENMFHYYSYSGTILIISGLMMNYAVAALLFRPIEKIRITSLAKLEHENQDTKPKPVEEKPTLIVGSDQVYVVSEEEGDNKKSESLRKSIRRLSRKISISPSTLSSKENDTKKCCSIFTDYFDLSLIKDIKFLSFSLLMMTSFLCFTVTSMFFSEFGKECGFDRVEVSLALSLSSIVDIPCRLLSGFIFDLKRVRGRRISVYVLIGAWTGLSTACLPISMIVLSTFYRKITFYTFWISYTISSGIYHTQQHTVLTDLCGSHSKTLSSALGLNRLFQGIGGLIGPSVGGILRDSLGTYTFSYVTAGCILTIMAIIFAVFYEFYLKREEKQEEEITYDIITKA
ncbi:unnamed protein product [Dimorphilus gyrociliatus]|uniref:Uncharacterized protein n=1 Tax=Dimorphilus gyrociliatus TaxID=2664684 RepID=A0A7I8VG50_9ANNE|nr:unnamed protein product [Dimorphilus gyrociliatus]